MGDTSLQIIDKKHLGQKKKTVTLRFNLGSSQKQSSHVDLINYTQKNISFNIQALKSETSNITNHLTAKRRFRWDSFIPLFGLNPKSCAEKKTKTVCILSPSWKGIYDSLEMVLTNENKNTLVCIFFVCTYILFIGLNPNNLSVCFFFWFYLSSYWKFWIPQPQHVEEVEPWTAVHCCHPQQKGTHTWGKPSCRGIEQELHDRCLHAEQWQIWVHAFCFIVLRIYLDHRIHGTSIFHYAFTIRGSYRHHFLWSGLVP